MSNNSRQKHYVVIVLPILMEAVLLAKFITLFWRLFGLTTVILKFGWNIKETESSFNQKLENILSQIDALSKNGIVSLVGCSAGGSVLVNAFSRRVSVINKAVNVCGAMRLGNTTTKFDGPTYIDSLKHCNEAVLQLSETDKKRIMTIRPRFGDEFIKKETVIVNGANNTTIPTAEHVFSVFMSLTFCSKQIISFLKNK